MDDRWDKEEMLRLHQPDRNWELRSRRWHNIYTWYYEGKTIDQIAEHYALSACSIKQVLRRAAGERERAPGFKWPEQNGLPLCDFAHRFLPGDSPDAYWHARARMRGNRIFCPICLQSFESVLHDVYKADMRARRMMAMRRHKPGSLVA